MKPIKQLFTLAAIALLITSCNKTDEFAPQQDSSFPADGVIRVATSVATPQTRAGMTTDDLSFFHLRIINENSGAYSYSAIMRKVGAEWGSFTGDIGVGLSPITLLWQNKTQKVKVIAVGDSFTVLSEGEWSSGRDFIFYNDQSDESSLKQCDVLYMAEKEIDPSEDLVNGKMQIKFNHRLSKLNLTVKMGTEFNKLDGGTATNLISDITVDGTYTKVNWKPIADELYDYSIVKNIIPWYNATAYKVGEGDSTQAEASYECILIPQSVDANGFNVSFKIGERDFTWSSTSTLVFDADTQYNLTLNVGKDVVTVAGFTATPWTEADPQDLGTE